MNEVREPKISICTREGSCYHCTEKCWHSGDIGADCQKWVCDRPDPFKQQCETCAFVRRYIKDVYGEEV